MAQQVTVNDARIDVDLCFVCDATTTMDKEILQVQHDITELVSVVSKKLKAQLRVAFVAYRDYAINTEVDPEIRLQAVDFTNDLPNFVKFLHTVEANGGGGDRCEDVMGGLNEALTLKWQSPTKVLFHMFSSIHSFTQTMSNISLDSFIHSCDDPPHGTDYHSFFDEIDENENMLHEFMDFDVKSCMFCTYIFDYFSVHLYVLGKGKDIFGRDSWEYAWIFKNEPGDNREEALQSYIEDRKKERDRYPDKHPNDQDHNEILAAMKQKGIQYYIANKTDHVNKMIDVFQQSAANIDYNVQTMELTQCSQLFETVYHSISAAITLSKEIKHTQVIQQRARRLFLDSKLNTKVNHVFQVFCGIDFGTDGTAFSYTLPGDDEVHTPNWSGDNRIVDTKLKTNILLDASKNFDCIAFGQQAREIYMNHEDDDSSSDDNDDDEKDKEKKPSKKKDLLFFEKFKMALYQISAESKKKKNEHIYDKLTAINGERCDSKLVIIQALKFVKENALRVMNENGLNVDVRDCQWVLTVPAIWSHRSKGIMLYCAKKAELMDPTIPNHLLIAFEPDCASIAIQHEYKTTKRKQLQKRRSKLRALKKAASKENDAQNAEEQLSVSDSDSEYVTPETPKGDKDEQKEQNKAVKPVFNADKNFFQRGEKYILADLGGGTADIAVHEVLNRFKVREIYHPSGGPYGSTYIDDEFIKLMCSILPKKWIESFKVEEPNAYVQMMTQFQRGKKNFWKRRNVDGTYSKSPSQHSDHHNVELPIEFCEFIEEKIEHMQEISEEDDIEEMEDMFAKYADKANGIEAGMVLLEDQHLRIHNTVWKVLFDKVVIPICDHIEDIIKSVQSKHSFKYLLLAGGFCESKYIRHQLLNRFGMGSQYKLRIVIPRRPILQVVTGAALYCKNQCYVRTRQLTNTIGIEIRESLVDFGEKYKKYKMNKDDNDEKYNKEDALLKKYENDEYVKDKIVEDKNLKKLFIDKVFHRFVRAGDQINIDDAPKTFYFKPVDKDSNEIEIKLYELDEDKEKNENKLFTNDDGCNLLATKTIKLPKEFIEKNDGSLDIPIAFFFSDTRIRVYIGIQGLSEKDANIDLDYNKLG